MRTVPTVIAAVTIAIFAQSIYNDIGKTEILKVEMGNFWAAIICPSLYFLLGFLANKNDD